MADSRHHPLGLVVKKNERFPYIVELKEIVAEEVDHVLGDIIDELALEGPALDLIATGELLEEGDNEDKTALSLNGDSASRGEDLVKLWRGDT